VREGLLSKRSGEIRGMFGRIAHRYDLLNHVLSLGQDLWWRSVLVRRLDRDRPLTVLDVCTGTGDVALGCARVADVVGTDFCMPMLVRAGVKARRRARRLPLAAADALRLPVATGAFDAATVAFGVRNFEDLDRGLAELVRVLRPGGRLLVLEFSRPRGAGAAVLRLWSNVVPPLVGRLLSGDPEAYSYLPASVESFPDGREMCARLERAGLDRVTATPLTGGVASLYEGRKGEQDGGGA
jgi:demethylmenaquinone methyltransferase/2-methoxy-6-polyprenyl-1,4-benzoquinol methylase